MQFPVLSLVLALRLVCKFQLSFGGYQILCIAVCFLVDDNLHLSQLLLQNPEDNAFIADMSAIAKIAPPLWLSIFSFLTPAEVNGLRSTPPSRAFLVVASSAILWARLLERLLQVDYVLRHVS